MEVFPYFGGILHPVISFIVSLSIIVFVHEYGHYIVGKWTGIKADVFSVGMGPVILSRVDKNGTTWQIAAIPFGGFVKFKGDANISSSHADFRSKALNENDSRTTLHGAPLWARTATVAAGPIFNFVFSIAIFFMLFVSVGQVREPLTVSKINPLPFVNQLEQGDEIISISGYKIDLASSVSDMLEHIEYDDPNSITYEIRRDGEIYFVVGPPIDLPRVSGLVPLSAAVEANLNAGDVILEFNGKKIKDVKSLQRSVAESAVESKAEVKVWRNKKVKSFTVKLGEREKFDETVKNEEKKDDEVEVNEVELDDIGIRMKGLNSKTRTAYNIPKNVDGVVVTAVKRDSFAAKAGLSVGTVISQISQTNVKKPLEVKKLLEDMKKKGADAALIQVFENNFSRFIILKLK